MAIFGAGIGGLTVAHELCKDPRYDITIYEMTDSIGGLAKSGRDASGCATEYSWRGFFGFYNHLFKMMGEIPISTTVPSSDQHIPPIDPFLAKFESHVGGKGSTLRNLTRYRGIILD